MDLGRNITGVLSTVQVMKKIATALSNDSELLQFSQENYQRAPYLLAGFDPKLPPHAGKIPWVGMAFSGSRSGDDENSVVHDIVIGGTISFDSKFVTDATIGADVLQGIDIAEQFATIVYKVVTRALIFNLETNNDCDLDSVTGIEYQTDVPNMNFYFSVSALVDTIENREINT